MSTGRVVVLAAALLMAIAVGCSDKKGITVKGIHPTVGPYTGGDPVRIEGSGFQTPSPQGVKVYFGSKPAQKVIINGDREIQVEPPAGEIGQVVDIDIVFDDARSAKLPKAYKYIDPIGNPEAAE